MMRDELHESRSGSVDLGYERMGFVLPVEDDDPVRPWPPVSVETLWVQALGDMRYRVDNIPFFVKPLAVDDIVSGRPGGQDEDVVWFVERLKSKDHSTIRVIIVGGDEAAILQQLVDQGASYEKSDWVIAVDLPDRETLNRVHAYLRGKEDAGEIDFEEACLPEDFFDE